MNCPFLKHLQHMLPVLLEMKDTSVTARTRALLAHSFWQKAHEFGLRFERKTYIQANLATGATFEIPCGPQQFGYRHVCISQSCC